MINQPEPAARAKGDAAGAIAGLVFMAAVVLLALFYAATYVRDTVGPIPLVVLAALVGGVAVYILAQTCGAYLGWLFSNDEPTTPPMRTKAKPTMEEEMHAAHIYHVCIQYSTPKPEQQP